MDTSRPDHVRRLLSEAQSMPPEERANFLRDRCEDEALREEIASLLAALEEASDFYEDMADTVVAPMLRKLLAADTEDTGPEDSDPLGLEGTTVGKYAVEKYLGGGGMGIVYRARDPELDRAVALKFLPPHLSRNPEATERFEREAKAAAALDHTHIATIYEIAEAEVGSGSRRFIAMAYYEGETLKEKLDREGQLSLQEAVRYVIQIAEALRRAHEAGIVHRDVKPANVMVTERGQVKLLDFGLATASAETGLTETGRRLGTASYMSPEQARGEDVGPPTDLWAVGALLYEMVSGKRPFQGSRSAAVLYSVLHKEPVPLSERRSHVESGLEQVVGRCLKKDLDQRYQSAEAVLEDLRAMQENDVPESVASLTPRSTGSLWSPIAGLAMPQSLRRRPIGRQWRAGGAAALALLLFLMGWALWPEDSATESTVGTTSPSSSVSIAVLPFETVGAEESSAFTDGVHGDVLTRLSNLSELKVISRTSVQQYRETQKPITEIGEELGAGWVLEGEVQESGGEVQVNARLINARTDQQAWARGYQRELTAENLFEIQEEITREIASSLQTQLTPNEENRVERTPTEDLQAYRLYVQGRKRLAKFSFGRPETAADAARYFRRAIERDSSYALAWAGLGDATAYIDFYKKYGNWPDTLRAPEVQREEAARRALTLDPDLAEAHASMGLTYLLNGNGPEAVHELRRATELKPSYWEAHHWLGYLYLMIGRAQQALDHLTLALDLNPQHAFARHLLYDAYLATGQAEKSLRVARRQQQMGLEETGAIGGQVRALKRLGRLEEARQLTEEQIKGLGVETNWGSWFRAYLVGILAAEGDTTGARKYLDQLRSAKVHPSKLGHAYAAIGDTDRALETYRRLDDKGWRRVGPNVEFRYGIDYDVTPLREDPRYEDLIRTANRAWDVNPDGSLPEETRTASEASR